MKYYRVTFDLCTYSTNKRGDKMLSTKFSSYDTLFFSTLRDARLFGNGIVLGLSFKYKKAAVRMHIVPNDGSSSTIEELTN